MKRGLSVLVFLSLILILSLTFVSAGLFNNFLGKITGKATSVDLTPRIAYWYGKVNQHTENGIWKTDPDGQSGANIDKLTYCKKWYPNTVSVKAYNSEMITTWRNGGNTGGPYTSIKWSYQCVQMKCNSTCSNLGYTCGIQLVCGVNTSCGSCQTAYFCSSGSCIAQKEEWAICNSDSECRRGSCDYDIFTRNNAIGNVNTGSSVKYCHSNSSKCLFYAGATPMVENDIGCTRCASWQNLSLWNSSKGSYDAAACAADPNCNGPWDDFIDTCVAADGTSQDNSPKWGNFIDCTGATPYCVSKSTSVCDFICVQCSKDNQCSGSTPKCVNNKCVAQNTTNYTCSISKCNDNNTCTTDTCSNNACVHTAITGCCISNSQCGAGQTCTNNGACVASCTPESDGVICSRLAKNCGSIIANDNCGNSRNVSNCGSCVNGRACTNGVCIPLNQTCTDNDSGINYFEAGAARSSVSNIEGTIDCCKMFTTTYLGDPVNHIGAGGGACVSEGPYLYEAYCNNSNIPSLQVYACPYGCKGGACVASCISEDADALCSRLGKTCGSISANDNCGVSRTVSCGTCTNEQLCTNGVCITPTCTDSDNGLDYYTYGTVIGTYKNGESNTSVDYCSSPKFVMEGYCTSDNYVDFSNYLCSKGCVNGVCQRSALSNFFNSLFA